jgi:hypothetical protein
VNEAKPSRRSWNVGSMRNIWFFTAPLACHSSSFFARMSSSAFSSSRPGLRGLPDGASPSSPAPACSTGATNFTDVEGAAGSSGGLGAAPSTTTSADAASVAFFVEARRRRVGAGSGAGSAACSAAGSGAAAAVPAPRPPADDPAPDPAATVPSSSRTAASVASRAS